MKRENKQHKPARDGNRLCPSVRAGAVAQNKRHNPARDGGPAQAGAGLVAMKLGVAFFALSLIFLSGILLAQDAPPPGKYADAPIIQNDLTRFKFVGTPWAPAKNSAVSWVGIAMLAVAVCFFFNAIAYVIGHVLHLRTLEQWAKSEFYQTTASALMIVSIGALLTSGFAFLASSGLLPEGTKTSCAGVSLDVWTNGPFAIMQCKIQDKIRYAEALYFQAYAVNRENEPKTSLQVYIMGTPIYNGDWDNALHTAMEKSHFIANRLVGIGINLHAMYMFADYAAQNMMNVFLPLGLLLRIFPPLRGIGAMLIAIALGFYIVFPVSYILMDPTTTKPNPQDVLPAPKVKLNACYATFSGLVSLNTKSNLDSGSGGAQAQNLDISEVASELTGLQIETFFIPLAALAVTLIFANALTPILGGDSGELLHFIAKTV